MGERGYIRTPTTTRGPLGARNRNRQATPSPAQRRKAPPRTPPRHQGTPNPHPLIAGRGRIPPYSTHINPIHSIADTVSANLERLHLKFYRDAGLINVQKTAGLRHFGALFGPASSNSRERTPDPTAPSLSPFPRPERGRASDPSGLTSSLDKRSRIQSPALRRFAPNL